MVITFDVLSRMVIVGMKAFNAPIGELVTKSGMQDLLFSGQELQADPKGWSGSAGFGGAMQGFDWKGWGQ